MYNLVDSQVVLVGNQNGTKHFEKTILPGRRTEEYDEIVADQPPAPFVYTVSNLDNDVRYYINGVDSFVVHWQEFDVYNILYIVRAPGNNVSRFCVFNTLSILLTIYKIVFLPKPLFWKTRLLVLVMLRSESQSMTECYILIFQNSPGNNVNII